MGSAPATLDPRTPVLVGVGQVTARDVDPADALEPTALLAEAARRAGVDSGSDRLLGAIDVVAVIRILSHVYRDAAQLVADELGCADARTIATDDGGNYPQALLNRACREIAAGSDATWLIGGAEAWRTRTAAQAGKVAVAWTEQGAEVAPDESLANPFPLIHEGEWARGVVLPATVYALFENALRAERGWTIDEHRDVLGRLYAGFSEVAATNPHAWIREPWSAERVRDAAPDNRMVGFPYTKVMNANNHVEQAACFVVTSVGRARDLGVPTDRWVFPWSGADAHDEWFVSERDRFTASPAIAHAGRAALSLAGVGVDDLAHIDVYSCFPSAVQVAAAELGLGLDRPLTVTGGLSFGGGPWNNYVSHSIASMADRLRSDAGSLGLVTANGGYLTKHAFGVYSTTPPSRPFRDESPRALVGAPPRRELAMAFDGPVSVEAAVAMHDRDSRPERAVVSCRLADGRRAWGATSKPDDLVRIVTEETVGAPGRLDPQGEFTFTA